MPRLDLDRPAPPRGRRDRICAARREDATGRAGARRRHVARGSPREPAAAMSGIAPISLRVYGCPGRVKSPLVGPPRRCGPRTSRARAAPRPPTAARSWLTYTAPTSWLLQSSRTVSSTCACVVTSSPVVGSSRTIERRAQEECHRQADALLLAAGELVRVAAQELAVAGSRTSASASTMRPVSATSHRCRARHHLLELRPDPERRVERRGGILRDVGDELPARSAHLRRDPAEHLVRRDADRAAGDPRPALCVAEQRERDRRLSRARLADEPDDLAVRDREARCRRRSPGRRRSARRAAP